jgi:microcystin-dependent protein
MAQPYVGEIRMFAGNFAPAGWMFCEGQLLPISEYETLFNLIGTTYGGDGQSTFALPDLRGRLPLHFGNGFTLAETGGAETITLTVSQIPAHSHPALATTTGQNASSPNGAVLAQGPVMYAGIHQLHWGESASQQFPAVSVRGLHHLIVRDLPEPDLVPDKE